MSRISPNCSGYRIDTARKIFNIFFLIASLSTYIYIVQLSMRNTASVFSVKCVCDVINTEELAVSGSVLV